MGGMAPVRVTFRGAAWAAPAASAPVEWREDGTSFGDPVGDGDDRRAHLRADQPGGVRSGRAAPGHQLSPDLLVVLARARPLPDPERPGPAAGRDAQPVARPDRCREPQ